MDEPCERWEFDGASLGIWRRAPALAGHVTAAIGAFACEDEERGARALREAADRLRGEGFGAVLGPMNGSTWQRYRAVTTGDGRPPFLMEPHNPTWHPRAFEAAGFHVVSRYFSAERSAREPAREERQEAQRAVPRTQDVQLRPLRLEAFEQELEAIFHLSLTAFARNAFYTPITREAFVSGYLPFKDMIDPELVLLAEDDEGELQGFLFGIADLAEGPGTSTVVLKTYASLRKGCGSLLADTFHQIARDKGYSRVVHALIHDDNLSALHSRRTGGRVFRRYALFGRVLTA